MKIKGLVHGGTVDIDVTLTAREERLLLLAAALGYGTSKYYPSERVQSALDSLPAGDGRGTE